MGNHHHHHSCTHCNCTNPVLTLLKDNIFSEKNFSALQTKKPFTETETPETLMISGGTIRPMINGAIETVQAIGIANGYIVVTGTKDHVTDFMQQNHPDYASRELDHGQTLLPGLIEPHVHIVPTAILMGWLDLGGFSEQVLRPGYGIEFVSKAIHDSIPAVKGRNWILGSGLDPALMPLQSNNKELITIDIKMLDAITNEIPLLIIAASMHTLYLNTPAMTLVYNNPANEKALCKYKNLQDYIEQTHGQLQEEAGMHPALITIPQEQIDVMMLDSFKHLKELFQTANQRGVTFMYDAGMNENLKKLLLLYLGTHQRPVRIGGAEICYTTQQADALPTYAPPAEYEDVYIGHVKVISDGSNQGLTGYQSQAYLCNPANNFGIYNYGKDNPQVVPDDYKDLVNTIIAGRGWPMMVHANGDLANQFAIETFQEFVPQPIQGIRHRIEHCSLVTETQLTTMKQLHISPSFLIGHVGYWGYAFQEAIFGPKSSMLDLCKSALKAGMKITLHSDNSVSPLGPLRMMEQAVTRIMEADPQLGILNEPECINREQALRAITHDAAWQCYAENWTGSLKTGHFADFVILQQDPLTIKDPYLKMRSIPVLETWVGGLPVYTNFAETATRVREVTA